MHPNILLIDHKQIVQQLRPLTDHRPLCDLLLGTSSIKEKWEIATADLHIQANHKLCIVGSVLPNQKLLHAIDALQIHEALYYKDFCIAYYDISTEKKKIKIDEIECIEYPEDLLSFQKAYIMQEIKPNLVDASALEQMGNCLIEAKNCFIHPTAKIVGSILDASKGPIYIGANADIQIGSLIQGPVAILDHSITNLGAKIRPFTTIGSHCKVGGEISYTIIHHGTNKAHEGYLGNSIIGSFCNFGALSNSSNVRNDLKEVKIYDFNKGAYRQSNVRSIGLITGDFITTGIGSQFNTATVIGSHCNITCHDFPDQFIPSFTWGTTKNFKRFALEKAIECAKAWSEAKQVTLSTETINRMEEIWKEL